MSKKHLQPKFIDLRAEGFSLRTIAKKIKVDYRTCFDWECELKERVREAHQAKLDYLTEKYLLTQLNKIKTYANIKERLQNIVSNSHFSDMKSSEVINQIINLDKEIEKLLPQNVVIDITTKDQQNNKIATFEEFCDKADYPKPFEKQIVMRDFAFNNSGVRMILGARGYGKSDYITIMGAAYEIYKQPYKMRILIITKSKERNIAMLTEIKNALEKNGIQLEKANASCVRVAGLLGKDHSISAVTLKAVSLRGRHPDLIILDDPVTEDDTSQAVRDVAEKKYYEASKLTKEIIIIGQPCHKYDLYEKLRPSFKEQCKLLEVIHGEIPQLDHDLDALRLAGVSEESIKASYFLEVPKEGSTPFDKVKYLEKWPEGGSSVAFIDPSFEGGDYTALTIMKAHFNGVAVVGFVYKKAWNHCIDEMLLKIKKYNVARLAFETNSLGDMPLQVLREHIKNIGIIGRKNTANKHARIMNAGIFAHLIHMCKESDKIYIDQVVKYEYNSKNDDAPDSLASCLTWLGLVREK
jgi:hypothetical protein